MYLHIGGGTVVPHCAVTGIFDMDNATYSRITRTFLSEAEKRGGVITLSEDLPKSFVVCEEDGDTTVYLSQLSSVTLLRRFEAMRFD